MDAYSITIDTLTVNAKSISDYDFFPNDMNNFINVGLTINPETYLVMPQGMIQSLITSGPCLWLI